MATALTSVCRALVAEEVPIRPFQEVYASFRDMRGSGTSLREIVERVRALPAIREGLPGNDAQRSFVRLGMHFEAEFRRSLHECGGRWVVAMEPQRCMDALTTVRKTGQRPAPRTGSGRCQLAPFRAQVDRTGVSQPPRGITGGGADRCGFPAGLDRFGRSACGKSL